MGITGAGLMTAQVVGAVTVPQTTVPLILHGELGRAVSASQQDAADILCSLTPWYRYVHLENFLTILHEFLNVEVGCVMCNTMFLCLLNTILGDR